MPFVKHDDVIQTLSPDGADDTCAVRILPRRVRRDGNFLNAQALNALGKVTTVDAIVIPNQESRRRLPREGVDDLLTSPHRMRVRRDVEVDDLTPIMTHHDEDIHNAEGDRGPVKKSQAAMSGT